MLVSLYIFFLFFYFFDLNLFFFNEEFLIFIVMSIVFYFLLTSSRKLVNSFFFFRVEFVYFSFLYLLKLNINLVNKILNLLSLIDLKFDMSLLNNINLIYKSFFGVFNNILNSFALISLKQMIYSSLFHLYIIESVLNSNNISVESYALNDSVATDLILFDSVDLKLIQRTFVDNIVVDLFNTELLDFANSNTNDVLFDIIDMDLTIETSFLA